MFISSNLFKCICLIYSNKWLWHAKLQPCFSFHNSDIRLCYLLVIIYDRFLFLVLILSVLLIHFGVVLGLFWISFCFSSLTARPFWYLTSALILWIRITTFKAYISFYCPCWREEFDRYDLNLLQNGNTPGLGILYFLPNAFLKGTTYRDVV